MRSAGGEVVGDVAIDGQGLGEEQVRAILERRSGAAAGRAAAAEAGTAVLVCVIGGERFAVPLPAVAAVLPAMPAVRVPRAPASLAGLIVRRGLVYNLVDPAAALGVAAGKCLHMLLLRGPVPRIALRIDEAVAAAEIAAAERGGGDGVTQTRSCVGGGRIELIALPQLIASLGFKDRTGPT